MIEFDVLNDLDHSNLLRLADLLESNLLTPPFSTLSLQDHIAEAHVASVSAYLDELTQRQASPSQIALILRSFAAGKQVNPSASELIDIVVSGPDVAATARDTGVVIRHYSTRLKSACSLSVMPFTRDILSFGIWQTGSTQMNRSKRLYASKCAVNKRTLRSTARWSDGLQGILSKRSGQAHAYRGCTTTPGLWPWLVQYTARCTPNVW